MKTLLSMILLTKLVGCGTDDGHSYQDKIYDENDPVACSDEYYIVDRMVKIYEEDPTLIKGKAQLRACYFGLENNNPSFENGCYKSQFSSDEYGYDYEITLCNEGLGWYIESVVEGEI